MGIFERIVPATTPASYRDDYAGWAFEQARLVRTLSPQGLDVSNLAEEIEDLGRNQYDKLESYLIVLLVHLLKWEFQPDRRGASWFKSVRNARFQVARVLAKNPSLTAVSRDALRDAYEAARIGAADETDLALGSFPTACPYSWNDAMTRDISWPPA